MAESEDPFDWSVDRVVHEFCANPLPAWAQSAGNLQLPDRGSLEKALRDQDIRGQWLLSITHPILKDDLGIRSYGQRCEILRAIEYLCSRSPKYQAQREHEENSARPFSSTLEGIMSPQVTNSHISNNAFSPYPGLRHTLDAEARLNFQQLRRPKTPEIPPPRTPAPRLSPAVPPTDPFRQSSTLLLQEPVSQTIPPNFNQARSTSPNLLARLEASIDAAEARGGLDKPSKFQDPNPEPSNHTIVNNISEPMPAASDLVALQAADVDRPVTSSGPAKAKRKRVAPTLVSHISKDPASTLANDAVDPVAEAPTKDSYLNDNGLGPEEVFYPEDPADDDPELSFAHEQRATGQRLIVAKMMKYFLQQPVQTLPNSRALAKVPYSRSLLLPGKPQYFTMFAPGLLPAIHNVTHWPALKTPLHRRRDLTNAKELTTNANPNDRNLNNQKSELDDFDYLLEKYPPKESDEVLALYGESGDEGEYDLETWREIEQEIEERAIEEKAHKEERMRTTMSLSEIEAAIDEAIADTKRSWRESKFAKVQVKAYHTWMRAARRNTRQWDYNHALSLVHRYDEMLERMRKAILRDTWQKPVDVKQQCKILEESVTQVEEWQYLAELLGEARAPPKPRMEDYRKKKGRAPQADLPEGEELLDSESELGGFVVDDSSDAGSIHHIEGPAREVVRPDLTNQLPNPDDNEAVPELVNSDQGMPSDPVVDIEDVQPTIHPGEGIGEAGLPSTDMMEEDSSDDMVISPAQKREAIRQALEANLAESASGGEANNDHSSQTSDLNALPRLTPTKFHSVGRSIESAIVLISSSPSTRAEKTDPASPSELDIRTPELNPVKPSPTKIKLTISRKNSDITNNSSTTPSSRRIKLTVGPDVSDVEGIRALTWEYLEDRGDNVRLLTKIVYNLKLPKARKLKTHLENFGSEKLQDQIRSELVAIKTSNDANSSKPQSQPLVRRTIRLLCLCFSSYACCTNHMDTLDIPEVDLNQAFESLKEMYRSFSMALRSALDCFCTKGLQSNRANKRKFEGTQGWDNDAAGDKEVLMHTSDMDTDEIQEQARTSSTKKRRKKTVIQSQDALNQQYNDQLRVFEEEKRKKAATLRLAAMEVTGANPTSHAVTFGEPMIFLDPHIGRLVKPHQVGGIQFMWRELVADPKQQGCLLAHTMGLGKTMQVVSLLVTIAQSARSRNQHIREQVPTHLAITKTLILCPPSLIDNWHDELIMWRPEPEVLGELRKITSAKSQQVRLRDIALWAHEGGVLIIGYELFRALILNEKKLDEDQHKKVRKELLESPTIIVADEAHKMKNAGSKLTKATKGFRSLSRIALTGSPLSNNLEEYHTMVDWIAPGYLGDMEQFRDKYANPISQGLYHDSTGSDRRLSMRKLHTLKRDLEPKINRADITAISADMPSKSEFFITLPLTALQIKAYNQYTKTLHAETVGKPTGIARLWNWLAVLSLLLNHPSCFVRKLEDRNYPTDQQKSLKKKKAIAPTDDSQGDSMPTDVVLADLGISREIIQSALKIYHQLDEENRLDAPELSNRSFIVQQIVQESIAIGDKVLIFSHSLPTLDYLELLLVSLECRFERIDGSTIMSGRQQTTKEFNKSDNPCQVFLISMKAGGLGLNLQGANRVIIYDFSFNPTWEEQAIGRAYRLGQQKPVYVYRFRAGGTFEDVIYNKAVFKSNLFSRVVDKKNYMSQASSQISQYLFDARDVPQQDLSESIGKDPHVLDRIIQTTKCIRNIELTETFQKEDDEILTAEEIKQADDELEDQQLLRDNPVAYERKQAKKRAAQEQAEKQARAAQELVMRRRQAEQDALLRSSATRLPSLSQPPPVLVRDAAPYSRSSPASIVQDGKVQPVFPATQLPLLFDHPPVAQRDQFRALYDELSSTSGNQTPQQSNRSTRRSSPGPTTTRMRQFDGTNDMRTENRSVQPEPEKEMIDEQEEAVEDIPFAAAKDEGECRTQ